MLSGRRSGNSEHPRLCKAWKRLRLRGSNDFLAIPRASAGYHGASKINYIIQRLASWPGSQIMWFIWDIPCYPAAARIWKYAQTENIQSIRHFARVLGIPSTRTDCEMTMNFLNNRSSQAKKRQEWSRKGRGDNRGRGGEMRDETRREEARQRKEKRIEEEDKNRE